MNLVRGSPKASVLAHAFPSRNASGSRLSFQIESADTAIKEAHEYRVWIIGQSERRNCPLAAYEPTARKEALYGML